jgi:hypothetical protein
MSAPAAKRLARKRHRKKPWVRRYYSDPWNRLDVRLELHFCASLQRRFGLAPVVYEDLKAREEN